MTRGRGHVPYKMCVQREGGAMQNSPSAERLWGDFGGGVSVIGVVCGVMQSDRVHLVIPQPL